MSSPLYVPQYKQQIAHTCPADHVLYGGAAGGGKSAWLLNEGILVAMKEHGSSGILFRRTFPELGDIVTNSRALIPPDIANYKSKEFIWEFKVKGPNGRTSRLRFGHINQYEDVYKYQGHEFDWIGFDEGTHFTADMITYLHSRNRTALPGGWPRMRIGSNPGNIGHRYMLDEFVRPQGEHELIAYWDSSDEDPDKHRWRRFPPGTRGKPRPYIVWKPDPTEKHLAEGLEQKTRCFIPATVDDNKYIDQTYKASLLMLPEAKQRALLHGDWDSYEGQFFSEFDPKIHVIDPITPPPHWRKWRGLDDGYADPMVCLWLTMDPSNGQIIVYREMYQRGLTDTDACNLIKSMTPDTEHIDFTIADPTTLFRGSSNDTMLTRAQIWQRNGVFLLPGNNQRVQGWTRLHDLFALNPETGRPGLVITRNCDHLIESLPTLVHSETRPEDLEDKGADSHAADALRYAIMSRGTITPRKIKTITTGGLRKR